LRRYLDGDEAPPLFHLALFWDVVEQDRLSPDGVALDHWLPEFPLKRAMAGSLKVEYHIPILPGQTLTARRMLCDMFEKQGSSGPLFFYVVSTEVFDAKDSVVLVEYATRILR
jgi:hydroxyacyl-ACP dehydratase HTD2-like protein with hotdog domain